VANAIFGTMDFVMEQRMLRRIKELAESHAAEVRNVAVPLDAMVSVAVGLHDVRRKRFFLGPAGVTWSTYSHGLDVLRRRTRAMVSG